MIKKALLSVAGFDPTAGAGVSLDLGAFLHLGFHGTAILTALTTQNTKLVKRVHPLQPDFVWDQYKTLFEDVHLAGIKVGMIGAKNNVPVIERILSENPEVPRVVDPVLQSSSGTWLIEKDAISDYVEKIAIHSSLLTPNLMEATWISEIKIKKEKHMKRAAEKIHDLIQTPCLIKGGHFPGFTSDLLYDGNRHYFFRNKKINKNAHGTGCFLSSCILGYLARGNTIEKACHQAIELTRQAIQQSVSIGQGQSVITFPLKEA